MNTKDGWNLDPIESLWEHRCLVTNLPCHDQDAIMKKRPNGENQHLAKERIKLRRMISHSLVRDIKH
jgi:hypothetical protein